VPFEGLIGNDAALGRLRGILERGRPAHAYLFSGPDGVGKKAAALEFARALGARPALVAVPEDKHEIGIAQVQEVIRELGFASREPRAVVVDDAHRMSEEAMNAFLKTLEEPPERTTLLLVTSVPQRLLDTIRSRCQTLLFFPVAEDLVARHVETARKLSGDAARTAARVSGGSIAAALEAAEGIDELRATARELQQRVLAGELNPVVEALGRIKDTERARREAKRQLGLIAFCLREALGSRWGEPPCLATPSFLEHAAGLDEDALLQRIETILERQRQIDLNANVSLAVEDALLRL
jgi:DNA polymerase-3 subunit delta'